MSAPLKEVFAEFAVKFENKPLEEGKKKTDAVSDSLKKLAAIVGAAVIGRALKGFVDGLIVSGDELDKTAIALGVTTDALQEMRYVGTRGGAGVEVMSKAMSVLGQKLGEVAIGNKGVSDGFKRLGIEVKDAGGGVQQTDAVFDSIADRVASLESSTERTALVMSVFGEEGLKLIPVLEGGSRGIRDLRREFRELGGGMSKENVKNAAEAADALTKFDVVLESIKSNFARTILPAATKLVEGLSKIGKKFFELTKNVDFAQTAMIVLGAVAIPLVIKGAMLLASWTALIAAGIIALALVVDDLVTSYKGGESVIRDFFLAHFDYDIVKFLDKMVNTWHQVKAAVMSVPDEVTRLWNNMKSGLAGAEIAVLKFAKFVYKSLKPIADVMSMVPGFSGAGTSVSNALSSVNSGINSATRRQFVADSKSSKASGRIDGRFKQANRDALDSFYSNKKTRDANRHASAELSAGQSLPRGGFSSPVNMSQDVQISVSGAGNPEQTAKAIRKELARERRNALASVEGL